MQTEAVEVNETEKDVLREQEHEADEHLVREALQGSEAAFGKLFKRYERRMLRVAHRILRNHEDNEDAVQQAFKHAFVYLGSFQGDSRFSTWLTRITINESLQLLRKRRPGHTSLEGHVTEEGKPQTLDIEDTTATPEEQCSEREMQGILNDAIGELRPLFRKVVEMYELEELTSQKTARVLGLTNSTVKARAFRARRMLRRKLASRLGVEVADSRELGFPSARTSYGNVLGMRVAAGSA